MIWRSLRAKLTATFSIVAVALIALAGLAVIELRALEGRLAIEHTTTTLFDLARDIRNRENRLFLFRKANEFRELLESIDATTAFLDSNGPWPGDAESQTAIARLKSGLGAYRDQLSTYWRVDRHQREAAEAVEEQIRVRRRELIELAEAVSRTSGIAVQDGLTSHRISLAVGITLLVLLMVAVANFLTRRIVRPLKSIENQMEQVAAGSIDRVGFSWQDRELVSLASAFNHVMSELELRQARAMQAEKLAALGTMLSGVAHELNNPLSNISTTVQIVSEEVESLSVAEARRLLERIDQQSERARKIVRTLLEYARADRERFRVVDALEIVNGAAAAVNQVRTRPRQLMIDGVSGLCLSANAERLERALINLIENAIDATSDDEPIVVAVRPCVLADRSAAIEFVVQDCGTGLSPEQQARMFDPFYSTKPAGQGTGLGLFITHEIVKQHGGTIDAVSVPGCGTSVMLRLPVQQRKAEA